MPEACQSDIRLTRLTLISPYKERAVGVSAENLAYGCLYCPDIQDAPHVSCCPGIGSDP